MRLNLHRLLPQSLVERVFALYTIALLTFTLAGLSSFYYYQFTQAISDAHESAAQLTQVIAPTVVDSAVIGDYDTVQRTLKNVLIRSIYSSASFIDMGGGSLRAESDGASVSGSPSWLQLLVMRRLYDVNHNLSAGGRDYGVLRLAFSPDYIAGEIWRVTRSAILVSVACFLFGMGLLRVPLRRWLGNLDRIRTHEWDSRGGAANTHELLNADVPIEIRQTFDVLNRTANSLHAQRARAEVTLGAIADGVITVDIDRIVVYANPVAVSLLQSGPESMLGRRVNRVLPWDIVALLAGCHGDGGAAKRIELESRVGGFRIVDCTWTPIKEFDDKIAGYVLTCRDVTESHRLDEKLRQELETRGTALESLRSVIVGLQDKADLRIASSEDIAGMSRFIADLSKERAHVTALLEKSVRELGHQKSALEAAQQRELEIGTSIQKSMLRGDVPDTIGNAWLSCFAVPSQGIDGDFLAIRTYSETCFEVLVGDVMGKGVPAALIGAAIRTTYNQVLADLLASRVGDTVLPTPADIVNRMHRVLTPRLIELSSFATLALYRVDLDAGTLTYVNAGHTQGLIARSSAGPVEEILGDNLPIGVREEEAYLQVAVGIGPGDRLLLFSDGITETRSGGGEEFGKDRLVAMLEAGQMAGLRPAILLHTVRAGLRSFANNARATDDQTALMIEIQGPKSSADAEQDAGARPALFNLPWSLESLAILRSRVLAGTQCLPESDGAALLLASFEAATNILRHAPPFVSDATLACCISRQRGSVVVELTYPSEGFTPPQNFDPDFSGDSEGGFGLYIIEQSVDCVAYASPAPGVGSIRLIKRAGQHADTAQCKASEQTAVTQ